MAAPHWTEILARLDRRPAANGAPGVVVTDDVVAFAREVLGLRLDARQAELLGTRSRQVILNCTRQWGKSTMAAAKAVHRALRVAGSLTVIVAPSERQSAELVATVRRFCGVAGVAVKGDGRNRASVVTPGGSRVVGLPASEATTRGFAGASLLIVDEASRVPDTVYQPMRAVLATTGGDLWLLSTPNGCNGFFYRTWVGGGDWFRVTATAEECPRILPAQLALDRAEFSDAFFQQEYMCEFGDKDVALFRRVKLAAMVDGDLSGFNG